MKKYVTIFLLLGFANLVYAKENDCPSAVDAAEAQNPNAYKDCDYSQTGLNGVLHRTFVKQQDAMAENQDELNKDTAELKKTPADKSLALVSDEFKTVQQLQSVKFNLLEIATTKCPNGFVLEGERYVPAANKSIKLELLYHCL